MMLATDHENKTNVKTLKTSNGSGYGCYWLTQDGSRYCWEAGHDSGYADNFIDLYWRALNAAAEKYM